MSPLHQFVAHCASVQNVCQIRQAIKLTVLALLLWPIEPFLNVRWCRETIRSARDNKPEERVRPLRKNVCQHSVRHLVVLQRQKRRSMSL
jgi:hypothetical protein